jgi:hypothetical protein
MVYIDHRWNPIAVLSTYIIIFLLVVQLFGQLLVQLLVLCLIQMVLLDQHYTADHVVVFAPEHGFRGAAQAGHGGRGQMYVDGKTGCSVYNTYNLNQTELVALIKKTNIEVRSSRLVRQVLDTVSLTCWYPFLSVYRS